MLKTNILCCFRYYFTHSITKPSLNSLWVVFFLLTTVKIPDDKNYQLWSIFTLVQHTWSRQCRTWLTKRNFFSSSFSSDLWTVNNSLCWRLYRNMTFRRFAYFQCRKKSIMASILKFCRPIESCRCLLLCSQAATCWKTDFIGIKGLQVLKSLRLNEKLFPFLTS